MFIPYKTTIFWKSYNIHFNAKNAQTYKTTLKYKNNIHCNAKNAQTYKTTLKYKKCTTAKWLQDFKDGRHWMVSLVFLFLFINGLYMDIKGWFVYMFKDHENHPVAQW